MGIQKRRLRYLLIVLVVALSLSMSGCLDMVNWGDPAGAQPGGEDSTAGEVIVEDAENVTQTVSHDVSSSAVRARYDAGNERVEVRLVEDISVDYMMVDFGGDASARARLYEQGDRVVLGPSQLWTGGEAEDRTRDLYGDNVDRSQGFDAVSYGEEVTVSVRSVEDGVGDLVYEETQTIGHGEVNAQVEYLVDSVNNEIRVVFANNVNADYVDVEFSTDSSTDNVEIDGNTIAAARLNEVGDEVRISSDYSKMETRGSAEDLLEQNLSESVERYDEFRDSDVRLTEILQRSGGPLSDIGGFGELNRRINRTRNRDDPGRRLSRLLEARRDLRIEESEDLTLHKIKDLYLEYAGQPEEKDDLGDIDSVLNDDVFDNNGDNGNFDSGVERLERSDARVANEYNRPERDELLSVRAAAKIAPQRTESGIRQRGGSETKVLDVPASMQNQDDFEDTTTEATIELPSGDGNGGMSEEGRNVMSSFDTERVADEIAESVGELRAEATGYAPELERTHHMDKAAQAHTDSMLNNIDEAEALDPIRSGDVPAQTNERSRIQRYMRSGATACHLGGAPNSLYTEGSYVALTDEYQGTVERSGTSSTRVNADGSAPITLPNYALPFYEARAYDNWDAGAENNAAFVYDDLMNGTTASEGEVADEIFDRMADRNRFRRPMLSSEYRYHGVGVSVDEETGVVYVTQSFC